MKIADFYYYPAVYSYCHVCMYFKGATEELHSTVARNKSEKVKLEEEMSVMQQQMKEKRLVSIVNIPIITFIFMAKKIPPTTKISL